MISGDIELEIDKEMKVYPNPTSGRLNINLKNKVNGDLHLDVFTINGKKIFNTTFSESVPEFSGEVDFSEQEKGTYLLRLNLGKYNWTRKIVLN